MTVARNNMSPVPPKPSQVKAMNEHLATLSLRIAADLSVRDDLIARMYATGEYSLRALASITGLNHQTVANIVERQS